MEEYKEKFIKLLVESGALKFGEFTLKSGRICPFFLNFGVISSGAKVSKAGRYYANLIANSFKDYDVIFGPAYKGIPLCVATASELSYVYNTDVGFAFNRKEPKDHGEGGMLVGAKIDANSRVIIIDDVMTAGTALRESLELLKKNGNPKILGVAIAVDRMEKGIGNMSAIEELKKEFGVEVKSITNINEVVEFLYNRSIDGKIYIDEKMKEIIENYRKKYGV